MSEWKSKIKNPKGYNPKELIDAFEEILRIEKPLSHDSVLQKIDEFLEIPEDELLERIFFPSFMLGELANPASTEERRYYFEPFTSYLYELIFYVTRFPGINSILRRSSIWKKELMKSERKKFKHDIIFFKLAQRTLAKMNFLENLQFRDEADIGDKTIRMHLENILFVYISKYINLRLQSVILNKEEGEQLKALEERIGKYHKFILILDKVLFFSESLEKDNLDEKTKSLAIEERNKLRLFAYKFSFETIKNNLDQDQARMHEFKALLQKEKKKLLKLMRSGYQ